MTTKTIEDIQCQGGCGKIVLHLTNVNSEEPLEDFVILCLGCADRLQSALKDALNMLPSELPRWLHHPKATTA